MLVGSSRRLVAVDLSSANVSKKEFLPEWVESQSPAGAPAGFGRLCTPRRRLRQ